jgi:anti-sigma B factor antagonist
MATMGIIRATVISLAGEWDIYRRDELRQIFAAVYDDADVVLDLSAVTYADSTVLSELVMMRKHRLEQNLPMPVLVPSKMLERILTITDMQQVWPCFPTLDSAVASFEGNNDVCAPSSSSSPQQ